MKRNSAFTIIELIISVGLLVVAISIALFATIGSSGLIQRTDLRATVVESGRAISDTFRRVAANASMSSVFITDETGATRETNIAVWVKSFSTDQAASICHVIGRASEHPTLANKYALDNDGTLVAYWIARMDANNNCVIASNLPSQALFQNRLTSERTFVVDFSTALTYVDPNRQIYPLLRYRLNIGIASRQGTLIETSQTTPIVLASAVPVGLINPTIGPLTIETSTLPDGTCGIAYSAQLQATGGLPNYSWQALSGLPSGFSLSTAGVLSGAPPSQCATGDHNITVMVTDRQPSSVTRTLSLRIQASPNELRITTVSPLPSTNQGVTSYSHTFTATGASRFNWSLEGPGAPPGAAINSTTGLFTFNPSDPRVSATTYSFQVRVVDSDNPTRTDIETFSLTVGPSGGGGGGGGVGGGGMILPP